MAELRAVAYVSLGVWVAQCPRPWCVNADHYGPGPTTGRIGGLTDDAFHCMRCGLVCPAVWPENRVDIQQVLNQRPMFETRNWLPEETVFDLIAENAAHGLLDADSIGGGVIAVGNHLTDLGRQIMAVAPRLAIGA